MSAVRRETVTVDRDRSAGVSRLRLGVTHTQQSLDTGADGPAVARAKYLANLDLHE